MRGKSDNRHRGRFSIFSEIAHRSKMMSKINKTPARGKRPSPHSSVLAPSQQTAAKDPVEVFCRVRPLNDDEGESCHEIISDSVIQIAPPETSLAYKAGHRNAVRRAGS